VSEKLKGKKPYIMERFGLRVDTRWDGETFRRRVLLRVYQFAQPGADVELTPRQARLVASKIRQLAGWVEKNPIKTRGCADNSRRAK
jgi:hypothetical protein